MFNLIFFYVLLLCTNKVSVLMIMVHRMNMVIWVFKLGWVWFLTRARNCWLMRAYVFGCIFICIEVLWHLSMFVIVLEEFFYGYLLHICTLILWKGNFIVLHHFALIVLSHLCCWVHIQENFLSCIGLKTLYVFGRIWVDIAD